jgi:hypothetical protein
MLKRLGWRGFVIGLIVGLAAGGTFAWAAIPDSLVGTIAACYPTSGPDKGLLRVVDHQAGRACGKGQALLQWPTRGFRWGGQWHGNHAYSINDVVAYNGSSYIATKPTKNILPSSVGYWALVVGQGAPGGTGGTGPSGPSNLAALQGTACASGGIPGTVDVAVNSSTDAATITCVRPSATVIVTAGTLASIDFSDTTDPTKNATCSNASFCSAPIPNAQALDVHLTDPGDAMFSWTCPGGSVQHYLGGQPATPPVVRTCSTGSLSGHYDVKVTVP